MAESGTSAQLSGRTAIVTGGAHGIGEAYCLALAKEGAKVAVADLDLPAAEQVARTIEDIGGAAIALRTDVSSEESTLEMARRTAEELGSVDILINNASIFETVPMSRVGFMEVGVEEWDRLMAVNLKGPWLCARAVFPYMQKRGKGKIINISSGTIFGGNATRPHYVASKAGVVGLTRNLARELGEFGINVNCIAPGSTLTGDLPEGADLGTRQRAVDVRSIKRIQVPADLVGTAIFLSSDASDFMTGQLLTVDGGTFMH
ncbi:MAG: SDR family NAD(P)-dependent oxidoreductase [Dehalococcoidia bacterium]